jgi:hypothetical protein
LRSCFCRIASCRQKDKSLFGPRPHFTEILANLTKVETLRSSPTGPPACSGIPFRSPFRDLPGAIPDRIPVFIELRSGLSRQPNISVRVGIPLARLAGD